MAPRNDLERKLAEIWQRALRQESIGIGDSFFDLGGSSIQAYEIMGEIARELGVELSVTDFLEAPTIEGQAAVINDPSTEPAGILVPFREGGQKPPWFCVHGRGGGVMFLRDLAPHLDPDRGIYGIQPFGQNGELPPLRPVEEMAALYLDEVQALQPSGPYYLGGSCFGGLVAREMGRILEERGEEVALLLLIDPPTNLPKESALLRPLLKIGRSLAFRIRKRLSRRTRRQNPGHVRGRLEEIGEERFKHYQRIHREAQNRYVPQPSRVPLSVLAPRQNRKSQRKFWRSVSVGGLEVLEFSGLHSQMYLLPGARQIGGLISTLMDRVHAQRAVG
ncbi:MAG TPA: thioesterase domain-containing protein [Acidimicrobiia bacterium]|jgi:thioesterase domain-containing protein/acyl carrier protein|nr:thioesterase domain-containing protein [Acidimicrobiia bacterium]